MLKKADMVLIGVILAAALLCLGGMYLTRTGGSMAVVYVDGQETARYPLSQNQTVEIEGYQGGYNILEIRGGIASVTEADCPDALCVHESDIQYDGQSIVCLPHRVVVKIENGEEPALDGIAG